MKRSILIFCLCALTFFMMGLFSCSQETCAQAYGQMKQGHHKQSYNAPYYVRR